MKKQKSDLFLATKNSIYAVVLQAVSLIYGFMVPRFILSYYGSELNGLVSSISQFMQYFSMLESGLAASAIYSLFKPLADKDDENCAKVVSECSYQYNKIGLLFLLLVTGLAVIFPSLKNASSLTYLDCAFLIMSVGFSYLINYFVFSKFRALFNAAQAQYILSISSIVSLMASGVAVILCISVFHTSIVVMKFVCAVVPIVQYPIIAAYAHRHFAWMKGCKAHNYKVIKNRGTAFVNEIFGVLHYSSPILILTAFRDLLTVSVYSVYNLIYTGITSLFGSINMAVSAMFGSYLAKKDNALIKSKYASFGQIYYYASSMFLACACALTIPFINVYTSGVEDVTYANVWYALLFSANCWINNAYTPQAIMIRAGGFFKEVRAQTIIQTVISVGLGLILTPFFGIIGLLCALIVSNLVRLVMAYWTIDVKLDYIDEKISRKTLLLSAVLMALSVVTVGFINKIIFGKIQTILQFILAGFLSVLTAGILLCIFVAIFDRKAAGNAMKFIKQRFLHKGEKN